MSSINLLIGIVGGAILSLGFSISAQIIEDRNEKFATSTMDGSQIEQVIYLESKLDGIQKSLDTLNDRIWIYEQRR